MNCSVNFACSAQYWLYFHLSFSFPFLKLIFMLLVCLFLAVLGLHCCVGSALVSGHRLQAWASVALACNPPGWTPAPCIGMGRWILNLGPPGKPLRCFFAGPRRKQVQLCPFPDHRYPRVRSFFRFYPGELACHPSSHLSHPHVVIAAPGPPSLHISFVNSFWPKSTVFTQVVGGIRVFSECSEF